MRGEERPRPHPVVEVLGDRPGQGEAIERARPAPHFVEDEQRSRGRLVEDARALGHLDHERALPASEIVRCSHAREEAVDDSHPGPHRRHE